MAIQKDQVEYEKMKSNGNELIEVLTNLEVLGDRRYLSEKVINNYLMDQWWGRRFAPGNRPIYLYFQQIHQISGQMNVSDLEPSPSFEEGAFQPLYRSVAPSSNHRSVCFFLNRNQAAISNQHSKSKDGGMSGANHFFPVVFDYAANTAYCFGISSTQTPEVRIESKQGSWNLWKGSQLWSIIGTEIGWLKPEDPSLENTTVVIKNWNQVGFNLFLCLVLTLSFLYQNGYDCGMYTFEILHRLIWNHGQEKILDLSSNVSFGMCMHRERVQLLTRTMDWIYSAVSLHEKLGKNSLDLFSKSSLSPRVLENIHEKTFGGIAAFSKAMAAIRRPALTCIQCIKRSRILSGEEEAPDDSGFMVTRPEEQSRKGKGTTALVGRDQEQEEMDAEQEEESKREEQDLSEGEGEKEINYRKDLLEMAIRMKAKVVTGMKEATRRSKPIQPYLFREARPIGLVKDFNPDFDSYNTGPTVPMLVQAHRELCLFFQSDPARASWSTVGDRFSDHGFRRTAGGFHQFFLNEPTKEEQLVHFFPIPPPAILAEWKKTRQQVHPEEGDKEEWTLARMVGPEAGEQGTEEGMTTYIKGRTGPGSKNYIHLNLHKSRKQVGTLNLSTDIDSILWVTDHLKVLGSITMHLLPYRGESAPIKKHNHAYVELYWPRTEEEEGMGRMSGASQEVPISNLPNTHFAHFGKTDGSPEAFVVFPRMKHKYPLRRMWETKIPIEVETFWLDKVVYPSLNKLGYGVSPYTNWTVADITYKHGGSREKGLPVSSDQLAKILEEMETILKENQEEESYTRFGSFFFVLQILGIKVSTSLDNNWEQLWKNLEKEYSYLDWPYMEDPDNGELLVDIGFGFHPPEGSQLVGFWDVDALRVGFDYGGYGAGTTHGVSTASAIGGIHSEMNTRRRKRTHIAYRLTYNLPYEVLRGQKTRLKENFFPFASAYAQDSKYREGVDGVTQAFDRCRTKSFGVRDEYRCRASSVRRLLPHLKHKVRDALGIAPGTVGAENSYFSRPPATSKSWTPLSGSLVQNGLPLPKGGSRRSAFSSKSSIGSRPL